MNADSVNKMSRCASMGFLQNRLVHTTHTQSCLKGHGNRFTQHAVAVARRLMSKLWRYSCDASDVQAGL